MTIVSNIPPPNVDFLDENGKVQMVWWQYLLTLFDRTGSASGNSPGGAPVTVPIGSSPLQYKAPADGALFISGGGVTGVQLRRGSAPYFNTGQFYAPVPMSKGDFINVTFINPPPTVMFLPR
ncbi:hypothetical protein PEP31012_03709 [Pandoraea eparura]|uniref:Uncharacterized protein n=1 Tax=Pandoraea eparura TaxID=2508291 RepID=A0A5E4X5X9_9BURK|nr:hypothetical protein [Pandoraea eparura]VVE31642.1 hypothetical protein PEP31012_03709 [Pandoraea eparura]